MEMLTSNLNLNIRETIAHNVRRHLRLKKMKAQDLARTMQVSRQYVYFLLRGNANPTADTLEGLANALGVTMGELLRRPRNRKMDDEDLTIPEHDDESGSSNGDPASA